MVQFKADPYRKQPESAGRCYLSESEQERGECDHEGWRHPASWEEVRDWLDYGFLVVDLDGDSLRSVAPGEETVQQVTLDGGGLYNYTKGKVLIEDQPDPIPPVTDEEEAAALASIFDSLT